MSSISLLNSAGYNALACVIIGNAENLRHQDGGAFQRTRGSRNLVNGRLAEKYANFVCPHRKCVFVLDLGCELVGRDSSKMDTKVGNYQAHES